MYRAVTWLARERRIRLNDENAVSRVARTIRMSFRKGRGCNRVLVEGRDVTRDLNDPEIARLTSACVASLRRVREALVERQRRFLDRRGLVAEGRDCGSVVFPNAPYKFYLTASLDERAARRKRDLAREGIVMSFSRIRRDLARREMEDKSRPMGALVVQPDAWIIDNTGIEQRETIRRMLRRIGRAGI
jgi:cytidylate kinase